MGGSEHQHGGGKSGSDGLKQENRTEELSYFGQTTPLLSSHLYRSIIGAIKGAKRRQSAHLDSRVGGLLTGCLDGCRLSSIVSDSQTFDCSVFSFHSLSASALIICFLFIFQKLFIFTSIVHLRSLSDLITETC